MTPFGGWKARTSGKTSARKAASTPRAAIPDNGFIAQGAPAASDTAMIDLGLKVLCCKNLSMFINASSQTAGSFLSYGGKAGFMWSF